MKQHFAPKLSNRLAQIAISLDSGNGEAHLVFSAAERLDELESKLRDTKQAAMYLRSTLDQVDTLLSGELLFGMSPSDDPLAMARIKASACLRTVAGMDFVSVT